MNNDASPSTSDLPPDVNPNEGIQASAVEERDDEAAVQRRKIRMQKEKRAAFLDDLIRNIDIMIYCELSVLYYMDCSLLRFLFRALPEWFYFTPKPAIFPDPPANRPYVAVIFVANITCILLHILTPAPEAGEAMHGYLHGGMLIDFVGQLGPVSKIKLVLLDFLTFALQLVMLAVVIKRRALKKEITSPATTASDTQVDSTSTGQDHDSEEQGILRSELSTTEDIELQTLRPFAARTDGNEDGERDGLLGEPSVVLGPNMNEHPLDVFNSGQHMIANLHIIDTVRTQWSRYDVVSSDASTSSASGSTAAMAAAIAERRLGFRLSVGGQTLT